MKLVNGVASGSRIRVTRMRTWCPRPLDDSDKEHIDFLNIFVYYSIIPPLHEQHKFADKGGFFMKKFQFTPEGFIKLQEEYDDLVKNKRPAAVTRLAKARSMGDLSENSEYTAAKEELAFADGRVKEIEELMKNAQVIDPDSTDGISIGTEVTVEKEGTIESFMIVGEFEADPSEKKLSATSPIGKALLGKKQGETVEVTVPAGTLKYKIKKIKKA